MGRLSNRLLLLQNTEFGSSLFDYKRCKKILLTAISLHDDTVKQSKKFELFWCVIRSEGDRHADAVSQHAQNILDKLNEYSNDLSLLWTYDWQRYIQLYAYYMLYNASSIAKILCKYKQYCYDTYKDDETQRNIMLQHISSFLHEQWYVTFVVICAAL